MGKILDTQNLYRETLNDVTKSVENWQSFLDSSSWNFKYDFDDQILIYSQRPDARACASMEEWNTKLKRWIKKGSNGIFVRDNSDSQFPFKIVFDISDTYNSRRTDYKLWDIKPEYENEIIDSLESNFGKIEIDEKNIANAIYLSAFNMVEDNIQDYLEMINDNKIGTKLENLEIESIETIVKVSAIASVSYMMMTRCGINAREHIDLQDISLIEYFDKAQIISTIGNAISDIAEQGLRAIAKTVLELQKNQNIKNRTFEKNKNELYANDEIKERGGIENGENHLHEGGRLQYPKFNNGEGETSNREIRKDEIEVSKGIQQTAIFNIMDGQEASRTSDRNSRNSEYESKQNSGTDGERGEYNGKTKSTRPNEMGATYEQFEDNSGGDSSKGNNLRLTEYKKENDIGYVVVDEKINQILATTTYLTKYNSEIIDFFNNEKDISKRADYLKEIINNEYTEIVIDNERFGYKKFDNGVLFWKDSFLNRTAESLVTWKDLTYHYEAMILLHQLQDRFQKPKNELEQQILIEENSNGKDNFEFTQEFVDKFLQEQHQDFKYTVYKHFRESLSTKENINFLKRMYGEGGSSSVLRGSGIGDWHDAKGITFNRGYLGESAREKLFNWNYIEKRISELIKLERYLNPKELEEYPKWLKEQEQERQFREIEKVIYEQEKKLEQAIPQYAYHLGDKVYIGADEYEIVSIDNDVVTLSDSKYPLFTEQMQFDEFDRKVKENPSNNHLIVKDEEKLETEFTENDKVELDTKLYENRQKNKKELINKNFVHNGKQYTIIGIDENEDTNDNVVIQENETKKIIIESVEYAKNLLNKYGNRENQKEEQQEVSKMDTDVSVNLEKNETPTIKSNIKRPKTKIQDFILHPEIPESNRNNFKITDNNLGVGTPKEKYSRNIEAIKVLKKCEGENRYATKEEQEILAQYVGWGGLADVFDKNKTEWSKEYNELKELLNAEEYAEARESTLTAFYTPPIVIRAIYKALQNMGLKQANILEPSCGVGNFLGMIPKELENCKIYGIEKDNISGRIAQQLYQKSTIAVQGYEKVDLPDSFFDVAVGNVPFGEFKVMDKRYDKYNFLIHDYFFSKTLDKVRPGGIIAFITSKGTMDKQNSQVRRYIAQRADLVGAIRLPSNTFTKNAGTKVTSDILFLQKRENMTDIMPAWVNLDKDKNGIVMNKYFVDNPKMILGEMKMVTTQYGREDSTCRAYEGIELEDLLNEAVEDIKAEIQNIDYGDIEEKENNTLPANPSVKNLSYTVIDGKVYFRENSIMIEQDIPVTTINRIKGMIELRDTVRNLIELQTEDFPDENIKLAQEKLNRQYDNFVKKYGLINSRGNRLAFEDDSSYYLLCSLEVLDSDGKFLGKADMFSKRTIKAYKEITSVDTANEALILSLSEKAKIDFEYMSKLTGKTKGELIDELDGIIYKVPMENEKYETADEYLSGNVREKLKLAESLVETQPEFQKNVDALKQVIPKDLTAIEIGIRLGATWIPTEIIDNFMYEILDTPVLIQRDIKTRFSEFNSQWYITHKNYDYRNVKSNKTYGTNRLNAYEIIEKTLNLKDIKIFDTVINADGTKESVFNAKETAIAQAKQEEIKQAFQDWIWKDQERRESLVRLYNDRFNSIRPREYDGSHLNFVGMNPEITLRSHQQSAIAHILYGKNTLLAHEVGAGKTFEMVAGAMESKRLGLCNKSLFVVPNHIIEQFASEFLQLYPSANIMVATKKDFATANRKKFVSRIATGDFDAVIIGHSQFERIPMSIERQKQLIDQQIDQILKSIEDAKRDKAENFTIKQMEKAKKQLEVKLEKLNNTSRKDDVITFEQLGVDKLFVDEAHRVQESFCIY